MKKSKVTILGELETILPEDRGTTYEEIVNRTDVMNSEELELADKYYNSILNNNQLNLGMQSAMVLALELAKWIYANSLKITYQWKMEIKEQK